MHFPKTSDASVHVPEEGHCQPTPPQEALKHSQIGHLSQEAQLGSQDELEGNHLRDLSVSLLSRTQFTMVS